MLYGNRPVKISEPKYKSTSCIKLIWIRGEQWVNLAGKKVHYLSLCCCTARVIASWKHQFLELVDKFASSLVDHVHIRTGQVRDLLHTLVFQGYSLKVAIVGLQYYRGAPI